MAAMKCGFLVVVAMSAAIVPVQTLDKIFSPSTNPACCYRDGRDGEAQIRIQQLNRGNLNIEKINTFNAGDPYTFVAATNVTNGRGDTVYLPLIVEASLRPYPPTAARKSADIPPAVRINVNNMLSNNMAGFDVGHIVAFMNGGTRHLFNFVAQKSSLNKGAYKIMENYINSWLASGGSVSFTEVITYLPGTTIPDEFTVKVKFFNGDGSLHSDCLDVIFKN